jgi:glycosyltransferase involved in cell wall biosynthesis
MQSVAEHHPEADRFCVLIARDTQQADSLRDEFTTIPIVSLGLPGGDDCLFQYDSSEMASVAQPWIFEHLFSLGYDTVVFIAPQIRIYQPLLEAFRLLDTTADVVLTPNFTAPISGRRHPDAVNTLKLGTYNPDFLAVQRTDNTCQFIRWWQEKLLANGFLSLADRLPADQRWHDLIPALCDRTAVLRHRGYNVTRWNLGERRLHVDRTGHLLADDEMLVFFNFSGFTPEHPESPTHSQEIRVANKTVVQLTRKYAEALQELGSAWYARLPDEFTVFSDGSRITPPERARFRRDGTLHQACAGRPFSRPDLLRLELSDATEADTIASSFFALGEIGRLHGLSDQLLGRPATPAEIRAWRPWMRSRLGMARLLLRTGLSQEARRSPGWLARLLRYIAQSPLASGPVRDCAVIPLTRLVSLGAGFFPGLAYRPCLRSDAAKTPEPHPKQILGHVAPSPAPRRPVQNAPGVNILGYFGSDLGIGEAARSLAGSCDEAGIAVTRIDAGELFAAPVSTIGATSFPRHEQRPIDILFYNADVTLAAAQHLRAIGHHSGYRIGFWHWEQLILPQRFHDAFAEVDELWVPSTFIQKAIGPVAPVPVVMIPHAVRFTPTPGVKRSAFGLPEDKCLVLVMYDFHSFQERKNPQAAIAAFRQAKAAEPSLGLVIKTINAQHHQRERQELKDALRDVTDVTFIDAALTRQQAWDLQMCCDILLSLHRAEGFGLILAEMMYLGKAVVATGWSANMDFMDESNSLPVAFELKPLPRPIGPYEAGIPWAEPDIDHASAALRRLITDRHLASRLGHNARETILRTLDPQVVGARVRQRLDVIARWFPRARAAPPR